VGLKMHDYFGTWIAMFANVW